MDVLVNNAGASSSRNFERMTDADWRELFDLNLTSATDTTRAVLAGMLARGWGRVALVSSLAAKVPRWVWEGVEFDAALIDHAASKAAMLAVAKALARRYGRDGVLVNSVLPGLILTPMRERAASEIARSTGSTTDEVLARMAKQVPVGRYGTPEEVAAVIRFLVSHAASYVNGAALEIDGGVYSGIF